MSRQLSKILVSCALVVTLLLAVVGTVFASYYSFGTVLNVEVFLNKTVSKENTDESVAPFAQVRYNGKDVNKNLSVAHTTKVDLDVLSKGYNFVGWYKGTKADYEAKVKAGTLKDSDYLKAGENNRLTFTASDYSNLVAVFDIIEYDVTWNYYETGADWKAGVNEKTSSPASAKDHYLYGERISADLNASETGEYVFCGWQIAGDETKQDYKYATFVVPEQPEVNNPDETLPEEGGEEIPSGGVSAVNVASIELNAHWRDAQAVSVMYYNANGTKLLTSKDVSEKELNYTLITPENLESELESLTLRNGYRYYWSTDTAGTNEVTAFEKLEGDTAIYLQEKVISYNVKVENDATEFASYNNNSTFTITVEDYSKLTEVLTDANWSKKYSYHMVSGVSYNGGTYSAASNILEKIFETNAHTALDSEIVIAPVVSGYKKIEVQGFAFNSYPTISEGIPEGKVSNVYTANGNVFSLSATAARDLVVNNEGTLKALNIFELIGLKSTDEEEVVTLYNSADESTREQVTLRAIKITVEGDNEHEGVVVNGNTTVSDFIETLIKAGIINADRNQDTLTIKNIKVMFCAESIQG